MPIRKRNGLWQADLTTNDGRRLRRSFPTKLEAAKFLAEHKDKPIKKQHGGALSPNASPRKSIKAVRGEEALRK